MVAIVEHCKRQTTYGICPLVATIKCAYSWIIIRTILYETFVGDRL